MLCKEAKLTGPITYLAKKLWPVAKGVSKGAPKAMRATYKAVRPAAAGAATGAVKGTSSLGRAAVKHPGTVLPAVALTGYGAYKFKDDFKRNLLHTDPKNNTTYQSSVTSFSNYPKDRPGQIKFRSPGLRKYYTSKKSDNILY